MDCFGLALALALAEGSSQGHDRLSAAPTPVEISGGAATNEGEFEEVVAIYAHDQLCSGVMVSPRVVLTAAHCVAEVKFGQAVNMFFGPVADGSNRVQAVRWGTHPSYCPDCQRDQYDYGFVELVRDHPALESFAAPIVTQSLWDEVVRPGSTVTYVGYGQTPDNPDNERKHRVDLVIEEVRAGGREVAAGGDGFGPCEGDSGAPIFASSVSGTRSLVGIHSRSLGCGDVGSAQTAFPALCWLRDEAAVDLLPPGCSSCDCIDTGTEGGCRVSGKPSLGSTFWLLLALVFASRGRTRLHARSAFSRGSSSKDRCGSGSSPAGTARPPVCIGGGS